jgi:hypothetical protein
MKTGHRAFPPGKGFVAVPTSTRSAARAGIALYAPCRPMAIWAQRATWHLVGILGPRAVPGRGTKGVPPMPEAVWAALAEEWSAIVGGFDTIAAYRPRQQFRSGHGILLIRDGAPRAFVKVRRGATGDLAGEERALARVTMAGVSAFRCPRPLRLGRYGEWDYLAMSALPPVVGRMPADPPLGDLTAEISNALGGLPGGDAVPGHWRPMHGDFTPWNLRASGGGQLTLVDWEDAGWGPPGADEVLYRAVSGALTRRPVIGLGGAAEAVGFWAERVGQRMGAGGKEADHEFGERLLEVLRGATRDRSDA